MDLKKPAILSVSLLTVMTNASVAPMLGLISQSFPHAGPTLIKQVVTIPSLMIILFSIISGQWVKVLPKKIILALGLLVYMAGAFLAAASSSMNELVIFRALTGAGAGLIVPLASSLITDFYTGKERAEMVGYSSFVSYAGAALAPLLAGWVASEVWQKSFLIYLVAIPVLIATMFFVPFRPAHGPDREQKPRQKINFQIGWLAFAGCFIYIIFYLMPTDVSFLIEKFEGANPSRAAALLAIEIITAAMAGVLFSHFTRKLDARAFPLGFGLMAFGFFLVFISTTFFMLMVGMAMIGLGIGTLRPLIILRAAQSSSPGSMTSSFALVNSGFSLGQFISPFFYYSMTAIFSFNVISGSYLLAAIVLLAAGIFTAFLTIPRPRHAS